MVRNVAPNPDLTCRVYKLLPLLIMLHGCPDAWATSDVMHLSYLTRYLFPSIEERLCPFQQRLPPEPHSFLFLEHH